MLLIKLIIIQLIIVFIVDISGFIEDGVEKILAKWLKVPKVKLTKPFNCSLCLTIWIELLYLIIIGKFNIYYIGFVFLLSLLTPTANNFLLAIKDLLDRIITLIDRIL